jgi:hypothetical protein
MTYHHSANKPLLIKRILFLCISFVIISATHIQEPGTRKMPDLVYAGLAKENVSLTQEPVLYPEARNYQSDCEVY